MNKKEYGSWSPFNKDNPKYSPDEYNRSFIKERFEPAGEYDGSDFDEYYQPPKMADSYNYNSDKKEESDKKGKNKNFQQLRQNLFGRVVCLAAGSVIITTSYQSVMKQQQNIPESPITPPYVQTQDIPAEDERLELSPNWNWSDDKQTVILELCDADGNLIKEITATVSISDAEATCNKEGERTYTATAEDGDNTYSDTKTEPLAPLGHDFDEGKETVLGNGETAITFECNRCHEQFTFETSMTENE